MTNESKYNRKVKCPLCDTEFWIFGVENWCPDCNIDYYIAQELVNRRAMENLISFQKVFSDVSGLLLAFEEVTENTTVGELLIWIKDALEAEGIDVSDKHSIQPRLPGLDQPIG